MIAAATDGPAADEPATTSALKPMPRPSCRARVDEAHQRAVDAHDAGAAEALQHAADHQHRQRRRDARRAAMRRCRPRGPRYRRAGGRRCRRSRRTAAASPSPRAGRRSPPRSNAAGVACMSCAMVGSAMLAIEVTSTDMATAIATASMARHRWCGGSPSVTSISCTRIGRIASCVLDPVPLRQQAGGRWRCRNSKAWSCPSGSMPTAT